MRPIRLPTVLVLALAAPAGLSAQSDEPLLEALRDRFQTPALRLGAVFQFTGDVQSTRTFPGDNGFGIQNMRLSISGRLDRGFEYFFQSNFGSVLDARVGYQASPAFALDVGRFKSPLSAEFLIPAQNLDYIARSQVVTRLVPGREVGLQVRGTLAGTLGYSVGMFNAGGSLTGNAEGDFHFVGRLRVEPDLSAWGNDARLEVGVNAARNNGRSSTALVPTFGNLENLFGVDARLTRGPLLLSAEALFGEGGPIDAADPWGYHATLGYMVTPNAQLLARWDVFDTDVPTDVERHLLVFGWNLWPTAATKIQMNLVVPTQGFEEEPRLVANAQLSF